MGAFHKRHENRILLNPSGAVSSLFIFELLFDTATLSILKLRMLKAGGCEQRLKSDLLGRLFMQDFLGLKMGPFHTRQKKHNLVRLKTEQFHNRFF